MKKYGVQPYEKTKNIQSFYRWLGFVKESIQATESKYV